jgi:hypothetical protein
MKKQFAMVVLLAVTALPVLGEQMTGYVSDAQCASKGSKAAKAMDWINPTVFPSCVQKCLKNGSPIVFVTEDNKVLTLDADSTKKASAYAGQRVSVNGKVENGTLTIKKIASIKMEAQTKPENHQEENMH